MIVLRAVREGSSLSLRCPAMLWGESPGMSKHVCPRVTYCRDRLTDQPGEMGVGVDVLTDYRKNNKYR